MKLLTGKILLGSFIFSIICIILYNIGSYGLSIIGANPLNNNAMSITFFGLFIIIVMIALFMVCYWLGHCAYSYVKLTFSGGNRL